MRDCYLNVAISRWVIQNDVDTDEMTTANPDLTLHVVSEECNINIVNVRCS